MISNKIKELRLKMQMSQDELAAELLVTKQAVSKWESGKATPTVDNLNEMSRTFSCKFEDIVGENGENVNWTNAWAGRFPILGDYHTFNGIEKYKIQVAKLLDEVSLQYNLSNVDSMLVLKDILYQIYKNKK